MKLFKLSIIVITIVAFALLGFGLGGMYTKSDVNTYCKTQSFSQLISFDLGLVLFGFSLVLLSVILFLKMQEMKQV